MEYEDLINPDIWLELKEQHELLRECLLQMPYYDALLIQQYFGIDEKARSIRQMTLNRYTTDAELERRLERCVNDLFRIIRTREEIAASLTKFYSLKGSL